MTFGKNSDTLLKEIETSMKKSKKYDAVLMQFAFFTQFTNIKKISQKTT